MRDNQQTRQGVPGIAFNRATKTEDASKKPGKKRGPYCERIGEGTPSNSDTEKKTAREKLPA